MTDQEAELAYEVLRNANLPVDQAVFYTAVEFDVAGDRTRASMGHRWRFPSFSGEWFVLAIVRFKEEFAVLVYECATEKRKVALVDRISPTTTFDATPNSFYVTTRDNRRRIWRLGRKVQLF